MASLSSGSLRMSSGTLLAAALVLPLAETTFLGFAAYNLNCSVTHNKLA